MHTLHLLSARLAGEARRFCPWPLSCCRARAVSLCLVGSVAVAVSSARRGFRNACRKHLAPALIYAEMLANLFYVIPDSCS